MDDPEETFGGEGDANSAPYEELVSAMAGGLYGELERLVGAHGPGAVSGLLPQLVSVLESLQRACGQVRERDQSLERLRDDRLRLLEQYERERAGRKRAEEVSVVRRPPVALREAEAGWEPPNGPAREGLQPLARRLATGTRSLVGSAALGRLTCVPAKLGGCQGLVGSGKKAGVAILAIVWLMFKVNGNRRLSFIFSTREPKMYS